MTAPSFIAFALVFLLTSAAFSLLAGIGLRFGARRLRALGASAEQRAAMLALVGPLALALMLVGFLAADSAWSLRAGTDHCEAHSHHLHLCLVHGADWASHPWAVALLAVVGCFVAVRSLQILWAHVEAQRAAWRFRRVGEPLSDADRCVRVPLDEPLVFTTGALSPTVVVSRGAWAMLDETERRAVLEHEMAHVENGDLWKRALLAFAACFAAPGFASFALQHWDRSAERICDRRAADVVGRPSTVAGAIVALARGMSRSPVPAGAIFAAACSITERVHSLLNVEPDGTQGAARLSWWVLGAGVGLALASAVFSAELHHFFETILG